MAKKLRAAHNLNSQVVSNGGGLLDVPITTAVSGLGTGVAAWLAGSSVSSSILSTQSGIALKVLNTGQYIVGASTPATLIEGTALSIISSATAGTNCYLNIQSGTTGMVGVTFGDSGDDDIAKLQFDNSTNILSLINSGNAFTLDSSGNGAFVANVQVAGLIAPSGETKTASFTASKQSTFVDATAGNITITLPVESSTTNVPLTFIRVDATANTITFSRNVNGAALTLDSQYDAATIISNGTAYYRSA